MLFESLRSQNKKAFIKIFMASTENYGGGNGGMPSITPSFVPKHSLGGRGVWLFIAAIACVAVFSLLWVVMRNSNPSEPQPDKSATYYFQQGKRFFNVGNFKEAKENFEQSLKLDAKNPQTYAYLGAVEYPDSQGKNDGYSGGSYKKAAENYEKALLLGLSDQHSGYWNVIENLGFIYKSLKRYDQSNEKFQQIITANAPNASWARYAVALDYFNRQNKPEEVRTLLRPVLNTTEGLTAAQLYSINFLWAELNLYSKDYVNAEKYSRLAIATHYSAENAPADVILLYTLASKGERSVFEKEAETTRKKTNAPAEFDCYMAEDYTVFRDYDKAIASAKKIDATSISSAHAWCLRALSTAYLAKGNTNEAKQYLNSFIKMVDALEIKNAFLMREYDNAKKELDRLMK
ncbi:MAG: hypothetical protein A3H69_05320 [Candidatus Sungbacteria bacterium RIFCSPLOWO2_02_FULL_47_9]|uniref:Uncharacterized protein n=1 Tax=Candidatus Sungbacteria bacterium RIFCSPHIGHO2_01_FULL_47_32 TaxID=1802264 RepID=A0A1G2K937_9BACT|nr:MAG: hypothetical protein UX72_C0002G0013 [Parcubacteria group bacterium GW2011_GWA2_47_10]OGZ94990.1 MAG: hypothetical protein A2633_06010 [Candidatus Sungbacteria bacterium RIFCSPHIGHO2_01_FULL_47_32]OGZ99395.1 MAG: hypothetical protein A3D57_00870 [Candidatus Sungbacteria bacterium RIFCSPHIGHO2_02_FULL_46_12]OHA05654.1 MAG: hypothetical protein A3A28_04390 [Candidatus Sungbacteria bacterium RIFCSPLOWO2_01_FULL_47_32]OHA10218.1 MAG: hypothetical protein A3H69_05320 [Candidatus Sungbacteria